ncbi:MAG TPA: hypothetical protein VFD80_04825 [Flavobacteriaceae bacterium]|nr:hypothetical protein [Flavobacteriaceae bacterium]
MKNILYLLCFGLFFSTPLSAQQDTAVEEIKELLGGTTAVAVYNTFIAIGMAADLYLSHQDNQEIAQMLAEEQIDMAENMHLMFTETLSKNAAAFSENDIYFLHGVVETFEALESFAKVASEWMQNPQSAEHMEKYDQQREIAWQLVGDLLGLDEE